MTIRAQNALFVLFFVATLVPPMIGACLALAWDDMRWAWLMAPLIVYHEAGFGIAIIMFLIALIGLAVMGSLP